MRNENHSSHRDTRTVLTDLFKSVGLGVPDGLENTSSSNIPQTTLDAKKKHFTNVFEDRMMKALYAFELISEGLVRRKATNIDSAIQGTEKMLLITPATQSYGLRLIVAGGLFLTQYIYDRAQATKTKAVSRLIKTLSPRERVNHVEEAAFTIVRRYEEQLDKLRSEHIETVAVAAVLKCVNYLVIGENTVRRSQTQFERLSYWFNSWFTNAAPRAQDYNKNLNLAIVEGVIFGRLDTEQNDVLRTENNSQWKVEGFFNNPRLKIKDEHSTIKYYSNTEIEREQSRGIDYGFCWGIYNEDEERGYHAIGLEEAERLISFSR